MIIEFPWTERWLNGGEYEHMIKHFKEYIHNCNIEMYTEHPISIYTSPSHGLIYYLQDQSLKELGFPRIKGLKKRYKWKKMNFVTNLPKQNPKVTYLVATGKLGQSCFRMHIVYYKEDYPIFCHMLRIQNQLNVGVGIPSRQHFKESFDREKENEESGTKYLKIEKKMHPVELDALIYMVAPFQAVGGMQESDMPIKNINA